MGASPKAQEHYEKDTITVTSIQPAFKVTGNNFGSLIKTGSDVRNFLASLPNDAGLIGVTCAGKTDGVGAQAIAVMSTLLYSHLTGIPYYHTPFRDVRFSDGKPDWAGRCESFFNLGSGENPVPENVQVVNPSTYLHLGKPSNVIVQVPLCHNYIHRNGSADEYSSIRDSLRKKYFGGSHKKTPSQKYIAAHVRRGDVSLTKHSARYTEDSRVLSLIHKFRKFTNLDLPLEIYSQGDVKDFSSITASAEACLRLNTDVFEAINGMVHASGLIMGRSSFSYVAAILGDCPTLTEVWYHCPMDDWFVEDETGKLVCHGQVRDDKISYRILTELLRSDPAVVAQTIDSDPEFLERSLGAQWLLARSIIRSNPDRAFVLLDSLINSGSKFSESATRTLTNCIPRMNAKHREMYSHHINAKS